MLKNIVWFGGTLSWNKEHLAQMMRFSSRRLKPLQRAVITRERPLTAALRCCCCGFDWRETCRCGRSEPGCSCCQGRQGVPASNPHISTFKTARFRPIRPFRMRWAAILLPFSPPFSFFFFFPPPQHPLDRKGHPMDAVAERAAPLRILALCLV